MEDTDLISLVYTSVPIEGLALETIEEILTVSRRNNPDRNVTGILLMNNSRFFQILEGPNQAVTSLLETIGNDPRHKDLQILSSGKIKQRSFADWSMAYIRVS